MGQTTIGQLNGKWSILLRFGLITLPIVITACLGFNIWVVNQIHELQTFQKIAESQCINYRLKAVEKNPPDWFKDRVDRLEGKIDKIYDLVSKSHAGTN